MPEISPRKRACALAVATLKSGLIAGLITGWASPVLARGAVPVIVFARPIIPPPYVLPLDLDASGEGLAPDRVSLAAGAAMVSDYDGSDRYSLAAVAGATARVHGHLIVWHGNSLGVDLVPEYRKQTFKFIFAPFVGLNTNRTGRQGDPMVALLPSPKMAIEGGAVVGFTQVGLISSKDLLTVQVGASHDLGAVHHSFSITPSASYMMPLSKAMLVSASASFDMVGAGYARTYYGIDSASSIASGLPAYRPGGGVKSVSFGLDSVVSLSGDLRRGFAVGMLLNYERLVGDAANSPIVTMRGSPNQFSAALGLGYTF